MNKYKIVMEYINLERKNALGCGRFTPLMRMINEDKKIIKELLKENDFKNINGLLSFLDYCFYSFIGAVYYTPDKDYNLEEVYNKIVFMLTTWNNLPNKWEIESKEFIQLLKDNYKEMK